MRLGCDRACQHVQREKTCWHGGAYGTGGSTIDHGQSRTLRKCKLCGMLHSPSRSGGLGADLRLLTRLAKSIAMVVRRQIGWYGGVGQETREHTSLGGDDRRSRWSTGSFGPKRHFAGKVGGGVRLKGRLDSCGR